MAIFTYSRVSTKTQAEEGESLGTQERMCAGYAMMHGFEVTEAFVERGVSGSVPMADRPEGKRLLASVKCGDVVITAKMDRMFRDARDALNVLQRLKDAGVALHMIDLGGDVTNGISKLVFTILSAVAEQERDRIRERIQQVKADQADRNRYLGGKIPFGFRVVDGALEPVAEEQAIIAQAKALRREKKPLRAIAKALPVKLSLDAISRIVSEEA